jgi:hypothetical protein
MQYRRTRANERGGTLALVLAVLLGILMVIILFSLWYTRFLGAHLEQTTAIEAASLAAAKDLGRIVVEDPYFGFVGLSDSPPTGKGTTAGDDFYMPVTGINTLFATIRLDLIISDYASDPLMRVLATDDYNHALAAKDELVAALNAAVQPGGTGKDSDGNTVSPINDAIQAYTNNAVKMTGQQSLLVPGSMKLALGFVNDVATNTVIPQPANISQVPASQQQNGFYKANVSVMWNELAFVFAGLGDDTSLVDFKQFQPSMAGLPYSIPTVVKVEADQQFADKDPQGHNVTRIVHAVAAAQAAAARDHRPAPGAFSISMLGGPIPEFKTPGDLFTDGQLVNSPCDSVQTATGGDNPTATLTDTPIRELKSVNLTHPTFGNVMTVAYYDWVRRGGSQLNVKAAIDMLSKSFTTATGPVMHEYEMTPEGNINYTMVPAQSVNLPVSENQWRAIEGLGYSSSNKSFYDVQVTDFCYQPGRINGGRHGGEPLDGKVVPGNGTIISGGTPVQTFYPNGALPYFAFLTGPGGGAVRPTYQTTGIAMDFTFRTHTP